MLRKALPDLFSSREPAASFENIRTPSIDQDGPPVGKESLRQKRLMEYLDKDVETKKKRLDFLAAAVYIVYKYIT